MDSQKGSIQILLAAGLILSFASLSHADVKQFKIYKEAFPDSKPKCIMCHTTEKPVKDAGKHDLNAYGAKAQEMASPPTVETYKELGPCEAFEK